MTPRTLVFVHASNELYGSDRMLLHLVTGLNRQQYTPIVILPTDIDYEGKLSAELIAQGITCYRIKMGVLRRRYVHALRIGLFLWYFLRGLWTINRIVTKHQADLIYSNTSAVFGGAIIARLRRLPHIWHIHEILTRPQRLSRLIYGGVLMLADDIICVSQAVAQPIDALAGQSMTQVIYNAVDCARFHPDIDPRPTRTSYGVTDEQIVFGIVGRISNRKGHRIFLEAAAIGYQQNQNLRFWIIGGTVGATGEEIVALQAQAESAGIADFVTVIPFSDDMPNLMAMLDVLVFPSIEPEALGLVVLEAMAVGRPVIASAHGGVVEIVQQGVTGYLYPPDDSQQLAAYMLELAAFPDKRSSMGLMAQEYVRERFCLDTYSQKISARIDALLPQ